MSTVYLNGEWLRLEDAKISVLDRGFLFGDGIYEVIPIFNNIPFRLNDHIKRLEQSMQGILMQPFFTPKQWSALMTQLIERNQPIGALYLQITRGADNLRCHKINPDLEPTVLMMPITAKTRSLLDHPGAAAVTHIDTRWSHCDIKSIALLANILLYQKAVDVGGEETILYRDNHVTEGASSNVFVIQNSVIFTPAKNPGILPGITREVVLELAQQLNINVEEKAPSMAQLEQADEIWITSSTREIVPIVECDQKPVGNGQVGPLWQQLVSAYCDYKQRYCG